MPRGHHPAHTLVAEALRARIAAGQWPPGSRLPSRAKLAAELGVGDSVVQRAQEQLIRAGLLQGRAGSGTYVPQDPVRHLLHLDQHARFGVRPGTDGDWTPLGSGPGVPLAYFVEDRPLLLAHRRAPEPAGGTTLLRAGLARPKDAQLLGLLRDDPVILIDRRTEVGGEQLVVPARYWDVVPHPPRSGMADAISSR
ncbi:GntR family transcriptional regulator [Kitasatospora sp. NPDC094015]|uniref:GntR family transcriptional regulator n=1 Tax=Kitasatospora sp. NPDC094015 TaxID=3155205 RepID=UPI0033256BD5